MKWANIVVSAAIGIPVVTLYILEAKKTAISTALGLIQINFS